MARRLKFPTGGVLLFAAIVIGAASTIGTAAWLRQQDQERAEALEQSAQPAQDLTDVLVALEELPAGTQLSAAMLNSVEVPRSTVPVGALVDLDDAVGRTLRYPMGAGEQLLERKLVGDGPTGAGLAFSVPPGQRAVSVAFSEVMGAGGLVVPGDRVDVLVATDYGRLFGPDQLRDDPETNQDADHPTVITLLQDVLVLAVGQEFTPPLDEGRDPSTLRTEDASAQPGARSVTVAITPDQAQKLFMATQEGTLGLALRGFGDESQATLTPALNLEPESGVTQGLTANR